ncbi:MAG: TonB-dependent receptor, partial [Bacteroidia bacterium]|nr:TonB-dependent receptor [Bacteroidia bacterium]
MRNFFRLVGFLLEFTFLAIVFNGVVKGQHHGEVGSIQGKVVFQNIPIQGASVVILSSSRGYVTDVQGNFHFDNLALGRYQLRISYIGFKPYQKEVEIKEKGEVVILNINLEEEILPLNPIEVTASRGVTFSEQSTVTVSRISKRTFDITQALNLAESLNFSPGLRIENNCQNCGFTQLRMLGLGGAYSQILINNRPIFSALAGVYGLEMLPSNMIERVEIVRGGGSVLYGSNAIAGIVNIITQQPQESGFEIGMNQAFTQFQVPDRTINASVTLAGEKGQGGASFYAFQRNRSPFDANADGFSEIPMLKNTTLGFEYAATLSQLQKIKAGVYSIQEFRRGGNQFDLPPHQATLAEQLEHSMGGAHIAYEKFSYNLRHKWTLYASGQSTIRNSYYGSGGRILSLQDTLTMQDILALNAYGNTKDWAGISGLQYSFQPSKLINSLLVGLEYYSNWVQDKIPGYGRKIDQKTGTLGFFSQLEIKPLRPLLVTTGIRLDFFHLRGQFFWSIYHTTAQSMATSILVPKLSVLYNLTSEIKLRASYTQGYRAPQAFDEDLHVKTLSGTAQFIRLHEDLRSETSDSFTASFDFTRNSPVRPFSL